MGSPIRVEMAMGEKGDSMLDDRFYIIFFYEKGEGHPETVPPVVIKSMTKEHSRSILFIYVEHLLALIQLIRDLHYLRQNFASYDGKSKSLSISVTNDRVNCSVSFQVYSTSICFQIKNYLFSLTLL